MNKKNNKKKMMMCNLILSACVTYLTWTIVWYVWYLTHPDSPDWVVWLGDYWQQTHLWTLEIPLGWLVAALLAPSYPFVFLGLRVSVRFVYYLIFDKIDDYFDKREKELDERLERRMKNYHAPLAAEMFLYREAHERMRQEQRQQPNIVAMNFTDSAMSGDINLIFND